MTGKVYIGFGHRKKVLTCLIKKEYNLLGYGGKRNLLP
jgi:hypothetical protein